MRRFHQFVLIASTLALSWLGMMVVHEFGHMAGARLTGGTIAKVVLHPLAFSRTDLSHNPHPLFVGFAGPLLGTLLPLAALGIATIVKMPGGYVLRFFAGFCLIANGAYLGVGWIWKAGDAGDLLRHWAARWQLLLFGAVTMPLGLFLWHCLGRHFGLGSARGQVHPLAAYASSAILLAIVAIELLCGSE
jgi:hypothetical protein